MRLSTKLLVAERSGAKACRGARRRIDHMEAPEERPCTCGLPEKWAQAPSFPVKFDAEVNEYHLVYGKKHRYYDVMRYCFWCGGRLPESTRGRFFAEPSEAETAKIRGMLAGARSTEEILAILGQPDEIIDWYDFDADEESVDGPEKTWTRCLRYSSRWKTLILQVFDYSDSPDAGVAYAISGKFIAGALGPTRKEPAAKPWWKMWG